MISSPISTDPGLGPTFTAASPLKIVDLTCNACVISPGGFPPRANNQLSSDESIEMSGETVAKRQKISHASARPVPSSKPKEAAAEAESVASGDDHDDSESEGSGNEETQGADGETPKTFKDLVSSLDTFQIGKSLLTNFYRAWWIL